MFRWWDSGHYSIPLRSPTDTYQISPHDFIVAADRQYSALNNCT